MEKKGNRQQATGTRGGRRPANPRERFPRLTARDAALRALQDVVRRSEEHTSELQSRE